MIRLQTLLFPAWVLKANAQPGKAVLCLLLQLTILGWGFAVLWATSAEKHDRTNTSKAARYARMFGHDHPLTQALMSSEFDQQQSLRSLIPGSDRANHDYGSAENNGVYNLDDRRRPLSGPATVVDRDTAGSGTSFHRASRHRP